MIYFDINFSNLMAMCILVMQRPGIYLKLLSNKAFFIKKKCYDIVSTYNISVIFFIINYSDTLTFLHA
jgi:hypothetical protein